MIIFQITIITEEAEIQAASIKAILPKALADCVSLYEIEALLLQILASTISHTTAYSRVSSRQQTQSPLSGTECS